MICLEIFVDSVHFVPNIYIIKILQYIFFNEMMFVVIYVLKKFLNKRKKDNQSFTVFVVFGIKQSVNMIEKMFEFRSFQNLFICFN